MRSRRPLPGHRSASGLQEMHGVSRAGGAERGAQGARRRARGAGRRAGIGLDPRLAWCVVSEAQSAVGIRGVDRELSIDSILSDPDAPYRGTGSLYTKTGSRKRMRRRWGRNSSAAKREFLDEKLAKPRKIGTMFERFVLRSA